MPETSHARTDVAIIGGGIMGSALAYWLSLFEPSLGVTVIERDPTYTQASSALSASSIRQQFSTAANIRLSQASFAFLREVGEHLRAGDERPDVCLVERGYLYLSARAHEDAMRAANITQRANGADVALLDCSGLGARFPWLSLDDVTIGSLGLSGEGWFDGYALLTAFARKARAQGVRYLKAEAVGFTAARGRVAGVALADGATLVCERVVNAAGPWAARVARWAGVDLPVRARRRTVFVIACRNAPRDMPLIIDPSGFWIRPEGEHFIAGIGAPEEIDDAPFEPEHALFDTLWPLLARRIPAFEEAKLLRAWAGYYEMNVFDHNAIIGAHPAIVNLYFINGFSGHGMQQAAMAACGLAEMMLGRPASIDLSDFSFARIASGRPIVERNIIG